MKPHYLRICCNLLKIAKLVTNFEFKMCLSFQSHLTSTALKYCFPLLPKIIVDIKIVFRDFFFRSSFTVYNKILSRNLFNAPLGCIKEASSWNMLLAASSSLSFCILPYLWFKYACSTEECLLRQSCPHTQSIGKVVEFLFRSSPCGPRALIQIQEPLYVSIILQETNQTLVMIFFHITCVSFPKNRLVKTMAAFVTYLLFY